MSSGDINEVMEAHSVLNANAAMDDGWKLVTVVGKGDQVVYVLGRHKETPREAVIRREKAKQAAERAEAEKKLW